MGTSIVQNRETFVPGAEQNLLQLQQLPLVKRRSERCVENRSECAQLSDVENHLDQLIALFSQCQQTQQGPVTQTLARVILLLNLHGPMDDHQSLEKGRKMRVTEVRSYQNEVVKGAVETAYMQNGKEWALHTPRQCVHDRHKKLLVLYLIFCQF